MPDTDLIAGETVILCPPATWTMILPSDWSREYWGVGYAQNQPAFTVSTNPNGDVTNRTTVSPNTNQLISMEMWLERHRTLVCQEWWVLAGGFGSFNLIVWTVRRLPKPVRQSGNGLILPTRSGRIVDDLSGYDPSAVDTVLAEMKRRTRRLTRA